MWCKSRWFYEILSPEVDSWNGLSVWLIMAVVINPASCRILPGNPELVTVAIVIFNCILFSYFAFNISMKIETGIWVLDSTANKRLWEVFFKFIIIVNSFINVFFQQMKVTEDKVELFMQNILQLGMKKKKNQSFYWNLFKTFCFLI